MLFPLLLIRQVNTMAWRCSGSSNANLVRNLKDSGIISSESVYNAMLQVDRGNYVVDQTCAYDDSPQPIGYRQTISAPHMHAHALEYLLPNILKHNSNILDVGSGSGYLTVLFAMMNPSARVIGVEIIPELVSQSIHNIMKNDRDLIDSGRVQMKVSSGWDQPCHEEESCFDVIHVGAAASTLPDALLAKLKIGGRMIIPVGAEGGLQELLQVDRIGPTVNLSDFRVKSLLGVAYVPLVKY